MPHRKTAETQRLTREHLNDITSLIIGKAILVHSKLGPGLLESVYRTCLVYELRKDGHQVSVEQIVPVFYDDVEMSEGYRLDLLVEDEVIVEIKTVERI